MESKVTRKDERSYWEVFVDGVCVGAGSREMCEALADELRNDPDKARFIKSFFAEGLEVESLPAGKGGQRDV